MKRNNQLVNINHGSNRVPSLFEMLTPDFLSFFGGSPFAPADDIFGRFVGNDSPYDKVRFSSDNENYKVEVDLPGVTKDNVDIDLTGRSIYIKASRKVHFKGGEHEEVFERSFPVQKDADLDQIDGKLEDGVLVITVPRKIPEQEPKRKIKLS